MNYKETLNYLYESVPMFQQIGSAAYKPGLINTYELDEYFKHPHHQFKTIHVGGTNGKGSCSHTLAAILQSSGYKVGLYTSPHLIDFRERIRINGQPVDEDFVIDFVENHRHFFEPLHPSFFELTTAMAFQYFAEQKVDVAIIEVGLGGKLDCTNIITPDLSVITNISLDHTQYLGNTLAKIATEKAGIIKPNTPVIIGEALDETRPIFQEKANEVNTSIIFAEDAPIVIEQTLHNGWEYKTSCFGDIEGELGGYCQLKNTNTILHAIVQLIELGHTISVDDIKNGFKNVCKLTGLMGRWQTLSQSPRIICDTGHNIGGIAYISQQLANEKFNRLHIVIGMVDDKDVTGVLALLPKNANYYFTKASIKRALGEDALQNKALTAGLIGDCYPSVTDAVNAAIQKSLPEDLIFVGGSTFVVADLLANSDALNLN